MSQHLHSLRMRSSCGQEHISGAERLLDFGQLEEAMSAMLMRALDHPRGRAERICLTLEQVATEQLTREPLLPLSTFCVENWQQGRHLAVELLEKLGLDRTLIEIAMAQLAAGPAPGGGVMRGAMLIDVESGQRCEPDPSRGVRVSRMDIAPQSLQEIRSLLAEQGPDHQRISEAWTLASKVALSPQVIAEICWSDDPDYLPGYVASAQYGYQRITHLKKAGNQIGGRIFFVRPDPDLPSLIAALQEDPVLFYPPKRFGG